MEDGMNHRITISKDDVLEQLNCSSDQETYEIFSEEYDEICEHIMHLCQPKIWLKEGVLPEWAGPVPVLYVLMTIGKGPEQYSSEAFAAGDYVKGMLADGMADSALFSMEAEMECMVREWCRKKGVGISERLEAPVDLPMKIQKTVYDAVGAAEDNIRISEGFMFDPVKTTAVVFRLSDDPEQQNIRHDCGSCDRFDCRMRKEGKRMVTVSCGGAVWKLECESGESLSAILQRGEIHLAAPCGGKGRCGKCRILVTKGRVDVSEEDRLVFTEKELQEGWRLSCRAEVRMNLEISVQDESSYQILNDCRKTGDGTAEDWGIAVDLGTTTIAMQRISLMDGSTLDTWNSVNHQRSFGADVISRIEASVNGQKEQLRRSIQEDLAEGIRVLMQRAKGQPKLAALAGNTVMIHLLRGYDCSGLACVPFTPQTLEAETVSLNNLLAGDLPEIPVCIFPGAAPFVGGDITAGLYDCGFFQDERIRMLIDLGTNGEMVLGNCHRLLCASTAAGPAFEGGGISRGMGSMPGAIQSVTVEGDRLKISVIGGTEPLGICGTGLIEAAASLIQIGAMDETGLLADEFFDCGYPLAETEKGETIRLTQRDIREIQLAKAAIRAGIETLLVRWGIRPSQVEEICLAGGFGFALDPGKAIDILMFPEEFRGKIHGAGNSSLGGCSRWLMERNMQIPEGLAAKMENVELSVDPVFQDWYIDGMMFGEE
ncbi:MAG: ASKHA domain-containing protein [Candidatus Choladocola sp.]|nr:ASKHA domain-containing protein [Candidatus Choladocola sp.]